MRVARAAVVSLMTLAAAGCGPYTERALLTQFFAASRLRDLTALRKISTVVFEPASDGIVTSFEIVIVRERGGSKEVWLTAPVRLPDGRTVSRDFAITVQDGLVTAISERPALSPVEGPAAASTPRP